jgi:hypothetical protein
MNNIKYIILYTIIVFQLYEVHNLFKDYIPT